MRAPTQWSDSNICIPIWLSLCKMLESKDHQQIWVFSGVLDLTFALRTPGYRAANVKSTPLALSLMLSRAGTRFLTRE
jgi:hypothetical protein